jgi:hypothetical protein
MILDAKIMSVSVELHRGFWWLPHRCIATQPGRWLEVESWDLKAIRQVGAKRPSFNMRNNMKQALDELD